MRIFHIATKADWSAARRAGRYAVSTRGRTLAEEGFIHCALAPQVNEVFRRYYADADEPLVVLAIDTDRLGVPWHMEPVDGQSFPHVHGAIPAAAVVDVVPMRADGSSPSDAEVFLREVLRRTAVAIAVLLVGILGLVVGVAAAGALAGLVGLVVGLAVGAVAVWLSVSRPRGR
ncbi:MAG: DUF952 domain-containing protein [Marmoricola sp.]